MTKLNIYVTISKMNNSIDPLSLNDVCAHGNLFVKRLKAIQKKNHLSDTKFAESIHISRVHWHRISKLGYRPGNKTVRNALIAYPDELYDVDLTTAFCEDTTKHQGSKATTVIEGVSRIIVTPENGLTLYVMSTIKRAILSLLTRGRKKLIKSFSSFSPLFRQG